MSLISTQKAYHQVTEPLHVILRGSNIWKNYLSFLFFFENLKTYHAFEICIKFILVLLY